MKSPRQKRLAEKAIEELMEAKTLDTETAHIEADTILCNLLTALGFDDVVDAYDEIKKWYA